MFQASSSKRGESRDELVNDKDKLLRGGATPGDGRTQEDQGQLVHLTGARSLLSLWILADHFAHRASVFTDRANVAVNSFIMMSGFVTQWAYGSRDLSRCGPVAQFLVRRLGRVALTTYVAMLGASALLTFTATFPSTRHLVYCLLFVEPWMDPEDWCPDGQSWTIAALMPSWILFPVTKRVLSSIERLYGVRGLLWTFFLLWCVSLGPSLMIFGLQGHITNVQHNLAYVWPPSQVPDFMLGMIAAMLARHEAPSWQVNQGLVLSDWERGFLADVALIGVFAAVLLIPSSGYHEGWEPLFNHALAPLLGIYFYGSAAAKGAGLSACLLTLPPLAQLGKYSFEVFLFQQPLFSAFEVLWIGGLNEILPKWVLAVAFMVTLYLLSGLYAELIEAPFVRWLRERTSTWSQ